MNEADLFLLAFEIEDSNARDSFLSQRCGTDLKLRQRIERLLRAAVTDDAFLETPVLEKNSASHEQNTTRQISVGDSIGPYMLVDSLGEGGMGTVFLADQTAPIHRKVAIKVIKPGMDSEQVLGRFDTERQAISMMNHPNIAQAFEVGTTDQGRPYFVMEIVDGIPISRYCDDHSLSIDQRLELFIPVCEAVQHAHQKGIIHRDLKPSNVLVSEIEHRSVPKIIDFGIAKAVNEPSNSQPNLTQFGQIVGTMEYMSPEQSRFNPHDVDTRSDIYSLGALLYELVAGSTPIQAHRLKDLAWDDLARWIREEEPVAPSVRITADPNQKGICDLRRATPTQLQRDVRGELDWIILKALAKDRSRRYQSASDMAKDIQRYLSNEPVEASPPSTVYRIKKYLQRNRLAVGSVAMVTSALLLGLAGTTWQAREASQARAIAELQRDIARAESQKAREAESSAAREAENVLKQSLYSRAIANFVNHNLLEFTDPDIEPDRNILLRTVLDRAAISIQELNGDPETQAAIRHTLAKSYLSLGEYPAARAHAQAASQKQPPLRIGKLQINKLLILGNSVALHGSAPQIGWTGNWGMAASSRDKDFAHVLHSQLCKTSQGEPQMLVRNIADFERKQTDFDFDVGLKESLEFEADIVIVAIGANAPALETEDAKQRYRTAFERLLSRLQEKKPTALVVRGEFWPDPEKEKIMREVCEKAGGTYVPLPNLNNDPANLGSADQKFENAAVAGHPGDHGMRLIADELWKAIERLSK